MDTFEDIAYSSAGRDSFRAFDLYVPHSAPPHTQPLLCFVHGGAWRSEDKSDHRDLARGLATFTGFPVAVPNYRLTPAHPTPDVQFRHPGHAHDILQFLLYIMSWEGPASSGPIYDSQKIYVIGHSCAAHMLASIFLDSSSVSPALSPPVPLLGAIQGIIMSEGIYDLDLLLSRFPMYREWFVENAFGPQESYSEFSVTKLPLRNTGIRWLIIHSAGDTLIDVPQSQTMYNHLYELYKSHADSGTHVFGNIDQLNGEHDEILRGDTYVRIVGTFVRDDHSNSRR